MSKRTFEQNISSGMLTAPNVAKLANVSPPTVYKWFNDKKLIPIEIPGTRERRVTAPAVIKFFEDMGYPITNDLRRAEEAFNEKYNPDLTLKQKESEEQEAEQTET